MSEPETYVITRDLKAALEGREGEILDALNLDWRKCSRSNHLRCPYPEHGGDGLNWRWDAKQRKAHCSCQVGHADNALDVLLKCEGLDIEGGKIRAAEILGRADLIKQKGSGRGQKTDPASLLSPPAALQSPGLPRAYLASRLGVEPADVPMPDTRAVGWTALPYIEASTKGTKTTFNEVAKPPCTVWETVSASGLRHAHRVYTGEGGQGKASLGTTPDGRQRDPKKSASAPKDGPSTAGCSVLWGNPATAERAIVAEGIETAAAVALAFKAEIAAGAVVVAAAIAANGVAAWTPYPATKRITVAADRDEAVKPSRSTATKAGEAAARRLGMAEHERGGVPVSIALPGERGASVDWLDALRSDGVEAVRAGIETAARFVPTAAELRDRAERAGRDAELERVRALYPLPAGDEDLFYAFTKAGRAWVHRTVMKGKGENAVPVDVPVSTPFGVTAWLKTKDADDAFGLRLVVEGPGRLPKVIDMDCGDLASMNGVEVRRLLLSSGMRFGDGGEAVAVALFKSADPETQINIMKHPGWHDLDGRRVFVCPGGEVIGLPEETRMELAADVTLVGANVRRGSLDGWKKAISAAVAVSGCPHFTLGVAAGFAGVLIDLCRLDSCGVNLSGGTSKGKSTSQKLATSPWSATESGVALFQTAKTTVNGFEALAAKANATILALDEMAHLDAKELAKFIYTLASGVGKTRLTVNAAVREQRRWRTFAMLSNEKSLEEKIKAGGEVWTGGMTVRVVDIDVDDVNAMVDAGTMQAVEGFATNYGWAGPAFVQGLVDEGLHEKPDAVKYIVDTFAERLAGKGADSATKRAARPLAILLASGMLAQKYGLLPPGNAVQDAVKWAWGKFTGSSEAVTLDPAALAVRNIRTWIAERWRTSLHGVHAEEKPTRDAMGWWDDHCVYLTPDRLVEAAGGALKEGAIAKALSDAGMLAKAKSNRNFAIFWVPTVGKLKAYALSRKHFGRSAEAEPTDDDGFKVFTGGRP